mmetsp:Transcript_4675/g.11498  ORF Transcript_4675/g.11498 Transcript_4675/m.11498 type:complete len:203 (-) Transcript_4675:266-874(-)
MVSRAVAKVWTTVARVTRRSPESVSSPTKATAFPTFAIKSRDPVSKAITTLHPSGLLPGRAKKSASTSSKLSFMALTTAVSLQGPLKSARRGNNFKWKFRAQNSAQVGGASSRISSWLLPAWLPAGRWPSYIAKRATGFARWSIGIFSACAAFARSRTITCRSSLNFSCLWTQEASAVILSSLSTDACTGISTTDCVDSSNR